MTTILKALAVRIALLGLAVAVIWNTVDYTQDRKMWFLCAFLISQLVDFLNFIWEVLNSDGSSNDEDKSLKQCLLMFLIAVCTPVCVMEQHRMQEFYMFYGRWDCSQGYYNLVTRYNYSHLGMVYQWTCIRTRPIIQCHYHMEAYYFCKQMFQKGYGGGCLILGYDQKKYITQEFKKVKEYKDMAPIWFKSFGNFTFLLCQNMEENMNKDWVDKGRRARLCYNKTDYWDQEWCKKNMDGCRHENVTDPYIQMKLRCRLVELIPFLCATVVSWILTSYDPDYRHLIKLLLRNLFIAADVFELFECFDEPIAYSPHIWTRVLSVWPICMLHLFFVNVMISDGNIPPDQETPSTSESDSPSPSDQESATASPESASSDPESPPEDTNQNNTFFEYLIANMDMWAAIISGLLHDGLLLYFRLNLLSPFDLFEPQIHFFIIKNVVLIVAQVFRAMLMCRPPSFNA